MGVTGRSEVRAAGDAFARGRCWSCRRALLGVKGFGSRPRLPRLIYCPPRGWRDGSRPRGTGARSIQAAQVIVLVGAGFSGAMWPNDAALLDRWAPCVHCV